MLKLTLSLKLMRLNQMYWTAFDNNLEYSIKRINKLTDAVIKYYK